MNIRILKKRDNHICVLKLGLPYGKTYVVTRSVAKCLMLWNEECWKEFEHKLDELVAQAPNDKKVKQFCRIFKGSVCKSKVDKNGYIEISDILNNFLAGGMSDQKDEIFAIQKTNIEDGCPVDCYYIGFDVADMERWIHRSE